MTPGTLIGGKYRLRRLLGDGAMGVVWAAVNELTEREVALKLLQGQNPELRRRLLREAKAYGRLSHKNIVDILDVGETSEGDPFLIMELLTGETLADRLRRERALSPHDAVRIGVDVARALRVAHDAGVIHRDLKPANIFLHQKDDDSIDAGVATRVKVLDFGVSKLAIENDSTATATGGLLGSPAYMSPEQVRCLPLDGRADLWALGVVLFEMLTGKRPFQSASPTAVLAEILTNPVPRADSLVPRLPPGLSDVIARCLERDIERRTKNAEELIGLLRPFGAGRQELRSTSDGASDVFVRAPQPAPSAPQFGAPPEENDQSSEDIAPTKVFGREMLHVNAVTPGLSPDAPSALTLPYGVEPPDRARAPAHPPDTEDDAGAPTELYRRAENSAPALTPPFPHAPAPLQFNAPPLAPVPAALTVLGGVEAPRAAHTITTTAVFGNPADRTMVQPAQAVVAPAPSATTVELPPASGAARSPASTSSTEPVSHGTRLPPGQALTTRPRKWTDGSTPLIVIGAPVGIAIGLAVLVATIARHGAGEVTANSAAPEQSVQASSALSAVPVPDPSLAAVVESAQPPPEPASVASPAPEDTSLPSAKPIRRSSPAKAKTEPEEPGVLSLNSMPSSKVLIDGIAVGLTPKIGVSVPPGTHTVTFIEPTTNERRTLTLQVKSGERKTAGVSFKH